MINFNHHPGKISEMFTTGVISASCLTGRKGIRKGIRYAEGKYRGKTVGITAGCDIADVVDFSTATSGTLKGISEDSWVTLEEDLAVKLYNPRWETTYTRIPAGSRIRLYSWGSPSTPNSIWVQYPDKDYRFGR